MVDINDLPLTMTAEDVNRELRRCHPRTLIAAWKAGKIKGKRINEKRVLYTTESLLEFFGLREPSAK